MNKVEYHCIDCGVKTTCFCITDVCNHETCPICEITKDLEPVISNPSWIGKSDEEVLELQEAVRRFGQPKTMRYGTTVVREQPNKSNEEIVKAFEKEFPEMSKNISGDYALYQSSEIITWLRSHLTQREIKLPEKKDREYFKSRITHADEELKDVQARAMEIGDNQAIDKVIELNK